MFGGLDEDLYVSVQGGQPYLRRLRYVGAHNAQDRFTQ